MSDPELEHRLLAVSPHALVEDAAGALLRPGGPPPVAAGVLVGRAVGGVLELDPVLTLQPGRRYLLILDFGWPPEDYAGVLLLSGRELNRLYRLPESGGSRSFGAGPESARWLALGPTDGDLRLRWVPEAPISARRPEGEVFARFALHEVVPDRLPVQVRSWVPYRADVRLTTEVYVETPRLYQPGYSAKSGGKEVPVKASPDGLVMVRLGPGEHDLGLEYRPPAVVRAAYLCGVLGWLGVAAFAVAAAWRRWGRGQRSGVPRGASA